MKIKLREKIKNRCIILDGAMGTALQPYLEEGKAPENLNMTHGDVVKKVYKGYLLSGSDCISTNTFGGNSVKYENLEYSISDINKRGVTLAKEAINELNLEEQSYVLLDVGPTGKLMFPYGELTFEESYKSFYDQIFSVKDEIDGVVIETMSDIYEMKVAVLAAKDCGVNFILSSMTYTENGRTLMGTDSEIAAYYLSNLGVDAIGVNCGDNIEDIKDIVEKMIKGTNKPISVKPNAGIPYYENGKILYKYSPKEFSDKMKEIKKIGVSIFGGCCGTNKDHIKEIGNVLKGDYEGRNKEIKKCILSSRIKVFTEDIKDDNVFIVNLDKEEIDIYEEIVKFSDSGALVLLLKGEKNEAIESLIEIQSITKAPIILYSQNYNLIEVSLKKYNGILGIMSKENISPLINKYGGITISIDKICKLI